MSIAQDASADKGVEEGGTRFSDDSIDYKNPGFLSKSLSEGGRMIPSRVTGSSYKIQRKRRIALLRARFLGLLPYVRK